MGHDWLRRIDKGWLIFGYDDGGATADCNAHTADTNRILDDGSGQLRMSSRARTKAAAIEEPVETPSHGLLLIAPTTTPERVPADRASAPSKRDGRFWCMANLPSGEGDTVRRYRFEITRGSRPPAWFFISVSVSTP